MEKHTTPTMTHAHTTPDARTDDEHTTADLIRQDGFRPTGEGEIEILDLKDFLAVEPEDHGEYIHIVPDRDRAELRIYRSVGDYGAKRAMTTIENARSPFHRYDGDSRNEMPRLFYLTDDEARNVLAFLSSLKWDSSRSSAKVTMTYVPNEMRPMMEKYDVVEESLRFSYTTESGRSHAVRVTSLYENRTQSIARY